MLQEFFNLLDLPGSSVRDLAGGENPFDQWASPLSGEHRLSGAQLVSRYTGASPDSWGSTLAGFGAEMVLDPTNLIGGLGILKKALATRRMNALGKVTSVVDDVPAGRYGYANPRALPAEAELITDPIRSSPLREDFGQRRIPMMESEYETLYTGTGKEWPPEPDLPLGRPRGDLLLQGTGGNREGPGLYAAQRRSIGRTYYEMLSKREKTPVTPEATAAAEKWAYSHMQQMDPDDPRLSYVSFYDGPHLINQTIDRFPEGPGSLININEYTGNVPPDRLKQLKELRDSLVSLRDELAQETGLAGNTDIITPPKLRSKIIQDMWLPPDNTGRPRRAKGYQVLHDKVSDYENLLKEFDEQSRLLGREFPPVLPPEVNNVVNPPFTYSGGLYELAVPKKKLDKFMYGDKPVAKAVAHIPEAVDFPVAVKDIYNSPNITGSEAVYHGDNRLNVIRAIAMRFGIENPTGADAQRILTETFGISGNKYLDAASRKSTNSPTYNHVIWDPEILKGSRVRRVHKRGLGGEPFTLEEPINPVLMGGYRRASAMEPDFVDTLRPTTWSPGTERLLNRKAAATLALYNMAARQGGYTVE